MVDTQDYFTVLLWGTNPNVSALIHAKAFSADYFPNMYVIMQSHKN